MVGVKDACDLILAYWTPGLFINLPFSGYLSFDTLFSSRMRTLSSLASPSINIHARVRMIVYE